MWVGSVCCTRRVSVQNNANADFTVSSVTVAALGETKNAGCQDTTDSNATVAAAASLGQEIVDANSILNYLTL